MQLPKRTILLTASVILFGCTSQPPQPKVSQPSPTPPSAIAKLPNTPLKAAVKELQMMQIKVKSGIDDRAYSLLVANTLPLVETANGESQVVTAVKSAMTGHQLALKFWQCDRVEGYDELHQCRDKVLSKILAKYPDLASQAKAAINAKDRSSLSTGLDRTGILERIWEKTSADTETASRAISVNLSQR
jgi:PBP1b-binding outer membrane lipoprotein LpoB